METFLTVIHVLVSVILIFVVLLQSGRGGGMGGALGGASSQIFGGRGAGNFLTRLTTGAAVIFFVTSLTLSMMSSRHRSVVERALKKTEGQKEQTVPGKEQEAAKPAENTTGETNGQSADPAQAPEATPTPAPTPDKK